MTFRFRGEMGPQNHFGPQHGFRPPMAGGMPFGGHGRPGMGPQGPQGFGPGHGPNPMAILDTDHDGKITKEEVLKHFAELDANKDDAVTAEELQKHLREHRPGAGPGQGPHGEHRPGPPHRAGRPGSDDAAPKAPESKPEKTEEPAKPADAAKQAEADFGPADAMSVIPAA
ncbi:MAG TPA: hypothetical protein VFG20_03665 [Planctomycetaceae bacterium]|nr:hypothetical protein [Planctomycetaceae bacterium]